MADIMDINATVLTLNGIRIQGFGDDAETLTLPRIRILDWVVGADGQLEFRGTGNKGGEMGIKLLPTGQSVRQLQRWFRQGLDGMHQPFNGTVERPDGSLTVIRNGGLFEGDTGPNQGQGSASLLEFMFMFETVRPAYDAVAHQGVPISVGAPGIAQSI